MVVLARMSKSSRWRASLVGGAVVALLAGGAAAATNAEAAAGCQVKYAVTGQWAGGFQASVDVTNLGDRITGWSLAWTFPSGQQVSQAWNATVTTSGAQATATNASYNATIATSATVSFGFLGSWSGSNTAPTSFVLNGVACTGTAGPTTAPPSSQPPSSQPPTSPPPSGDAMAYVAAMQPGWNLGNTLDSTGSDETSWGNPRVTKELLDKVRAEGFNSIRIPVTWGQHQGSAPSYTVDAAYLSRVKEVVDWALADGFYVMLNVHHDSWQWINNLNSDHTNVMNRFNALWTQIATTFRNEPAKLNFESDNEPQFSGTSGDTQDISLLAELNKSFYQIVRNTGGNNATRMLVLPTLHTSAETQERVDGLVSTFTDLNDRNLIATIHFYGYWPFSVNIAGHPTFDADVQKDLTDQFDRVNNAFVAKGIPVVIGEYGVLGWDKAAGAIEQGELLKYFEYLGYYAKLRKLTTMLWDNGSRFNRTTYQWNEPELIAQIKSSWTTRSGNASSDQVYLPKSGTITSKSLTLNLNGTTFQGLRQGSTDLVNGTDYTVSGSQLTLSAALLTRLAGNRAYGVNATVQARFSQGLPWKINIITYDVPVVSNATGTTTSFAIPTQFRGDQLQTMEAKYADGSGAGPNNWTTYKEYDVAYLPDYSANTVTLKPAFFDAVNDSQRVTLVLHFWSGDTVTYYVTKSGTAVTGTTS
jgi:endoglucanase